MQLFHCTCMKSPSNSLSCSKYSRCSSDRLVLCTRTWACSSTWLYKLLTDSTASLPDVWNLSPFERCRFVCCSCMSVTKKYGKTILEWDVTHSRIGFGLPEVLTVGIFQVTLLPESGQNGSALPLQLDQSTVLQHILH